MIVFCCKGISPPVDNQRARAHTHANADPTDRTEAADEDDEDEDDDGGGEGRVRWGEYREQTLYEVLYRCQEVLRSRYVAALEARLPAAVAACVGGGGGGGEGQWQVRTRVGRALVSFLATYLLHMTMTHLLAH